MKKIMSILGSISIACLVVTFAWAQCPSDESLIVKVTPQKLNLSSQGNYIKAHIQLLEGGPAELQVFLASLVDNPLQIVCAAGVELENPINMIPGTAEIDKDGEVLTVAFYRQNLIAELNALGINDTTVCIKISQEGVALPGIPVGDITLMINCGSVSLGSFLVDDVIGITTLNLGTPTSGDPADIKVEVVTEGSVYLFTIFSGPVVDPLSIDVTGGTDDLYTLAITNGVPQGATIVINLEAYGEPGTLTLSGASLTGNNGGGEPVPGLNGTDTIRVK